MDLISKVEKEQAINYEAGLKIQEQIGAVNYVECSAKTLEGIDDVLEKAAEMMETKIWCKNSLCIIVRGLS